MSQQQKKRSHWPVSTLTGLSSIVNMLLPLILVRILAPEEVGIYKAFFLYLLIAPGISLIAGIWSGVAYWAGQGARAKPALQVSSMIVLLLAFTTAGISYAIHPWVAHLLGWGSFEAEIFSLALLGTIAGGFFEEAAIATGRAWTGALVYAGFEALKTVAMVSAAWFYRDVEAVLVAYAIVATTKIVVTYGYGMFLGLVGLSFDWRIIRSVVAYAFPVSIAWVFGIFVDRSDQIVLSATLTPDDFAYYTIGCLVVPPLLTLEHSITRVLMPQLSEAFAHKQSARGAELFANAVENLAFFFVPAVTGLIVFSAPIIEILFTPHYLPAQQFLSVFALTYLLFIVPYDVVPRARGNSGWILKNFIVFSMIAISTAYLFTAYWGAMGALVALIFSKGLMRLNGVLYIVRNTEWRLPTIFRPRELSRIVIVSLLFGCGAWAARPLFSDSRGWFFVMGGFFLVGYFPIMITLHHRSQRRRLLSPRVLMLTQRLPIGGLERMVFDLCVALKRNGPWQPAVFAYDQPEEEVSTGLIPQFEAQGIPVEVAQKRGGFSITTVLRLLSFVFRNDITLIHSHNIGPLIYGCCCKLLSLGKVRLIHTQHSWVHLNDEKRYSWYERIFSSIADEIVVVADEMKHTYESLGVSLKKISAISNGVRLDHHVVVNRAERLARREVLLASLSDDGIRSSLSVHPDDRWILYLARLHPGKGQRHALKVWSALSEGQRRTSRLIFVGPESYPDELTRLKAEAAAVPDAERVVFVGGTHSPSSWLMAGDLFLSCSDFEGMPLTPLEAIGSGLPTVVSKISGHAFLSPLSAQFALGDWEGGARVVEETLARFADDKESSTLEAFAMSVRQSYSIDEMALRYAHIYGAETQRHAALSPRPLST